MLTVTPICHILHAAEQNSSSSSFSYFCMLWCSWCGKAVQVDLVLSRLITLQSRIDATEELILLELGHRRNEIVSFTLV